MIVASEPPIIQVEHLSVGFGNQHVLRNLMLNVHPSETLVVVGESGCGKTVLLKMIVALLKPDQGRVLFEGKGIAELSPAELAKVRRRFGFLFQGAALFDSLSVGENVAYPLRALHSLREAEIRERVLARLKEVGLAENAASKLPAELSGGMRKRVGLARALALDPDVMLYDEPTTGLDPVMTELINDLIVQTRQRQPVTSVVVTHDMKTVRQVGDRVVMLYPLSRLGTDETQVIYDGTAEGLATFHDERVRRFAA